MTWEGSGRDPFLGSPTGKAEHSLPSPHPLPAAWGPRTWKGAAEPWAEAHKYPLGRQASSCPGPSPPEQGCRGTSKACGGLLVAVPLKSWEVTVMQGRTSSCSYSHWPLSPASSQVRVEGGRENAGVGGRAGGSPQHVRRVHMVLVIHKTPLDFQDYL